MSVVDFLSEWVKVFRPRPNRDQLNVRWLHVQYYFEGFPLPFRFAREHFHCLLLKSLLSLSLVNVAASLV